MTGPAILRLCAVGTLVLLAACNDAGQFSLGKPETEVTRAAPQATQLVERDVEAPDVFQVTEAGLWDGRPSLGGVWVAHPSAADPERVIIRNPENGKFVIGALFRKERETPGPRIQVSADAARALDLIAGSPVELNVTALRREQVPDAVPAKADASLPTAPEVTASVLDDDPIASAASAAIDASAPNPQPIPEQTTAAPQPTPVVAAATSTLAKPFVQIGIFSVEDNARRTADRLRGAGVVPTVLAQQSNGKPFWRVIVGPTNSENDRAEVLKTVKAQGFSDAYFVTN